MTLNLKEALQEIDAMRGWRAFIMLPPKCANAEGIVEVLPWIEKGTPRPGTTMHLFDVRSGLALVTGGVLTEEEGTRLFIIHDQLKGVATKMFVVPPAAAPPPLIARMYDTGAAPILPVAERLPNSNFWSVISVLAGLMFVITLFAGAAAMARGGEAARALSILPWPLLSGSVICGITSWFQWLRRQDILKDPVRMTIMQWARTLPPFVARR
jgi:hypothetical protein